MSKKRNNSNINRRGDNQAVAKYLDKIAVIEKGVSHRKLRARALCTHTHEPLTPALSYRTEDGKTVWVCKICGARVNLNRISDEELNRAIATINQACDLVKIMSCGNDNDTKLVEEVIADIQLKVNAYLVNAYKAALNSSNKNAARRGNRNSGRRISWTD